MAEWIGAAETLLTRSLGRLGLSRPHWLRTSGLQLDHGHLPFGAWEAELTAYAQLRTGGRVKVLFGHTGEVTWGEEIHLHRPRPGTPPQLALHGAEEELEHALMHHRHGW